jgi:hypothetical protein
MDKKLLAETVILIGLTLPLLWVLSVRRTIGFAVAAALIWYCGRQLYGWYEATGGTDIGQGSPAWLLAACAVGVIAGCALAIVTWRAKVH